MSDDAEDIVTIEIEDSYEKVMGEIGGRRGLGETGMKTEPPDSHPIESDNILSEIRKEAEKLNLTTKDDRLSVKDKANRYDGAIATHICNSLIAVGTSGAAIALMNKIEPILLQWMKNRGTRTVTVKKADWSVTMKGGGNPRKLIEQLQERDKPKE